MITLLSVTAFVHFSLILICFVDGLVDMWVSSTTEAQPTDHPLEKAVEDPWEASVVVEPVNSPNRDSKAPTASISIACGTAAR